MRFTEGSPRLLAQLLADAAFFLAAGFELMQGRAAQFRGIGGFV